MVNRIIQITSVLKKLAVLAITISGLLIGQSDVRAQLACDCSSASDCAAGTCNCPGCGAFWQSAPSSVPYESAVPSAGEGAAPYAGAPVVTAAGGACRRASSANRVTGSPVEKVCGGVAGVRRAAGRGFA